MISMDKEKELKFLEALYLIQKTALFDFGNISLDKGHDKEPGVRGIIKDEIS